MTFWVGLRVIFCGQGAFSASTGAPVGFDNNAWAMPLWNYRFKLNVHDVVPGHLALSWGILIHVSGSNVSSPIDRSHSEFKFVSGVSYTFHLMRSQVRQESFSESAYLSRFLELCRGVAFARKRRYIIRWALSRNCSLDTGLLEYSVNVESLWQV